MNGSIRRIALAGALTALVAGVGVSAQAETAVDITEHPWIGEAAPEFSLTTVGGAEFSLQDLKGKYVVIHFGTSW